jgi:hypothetical protein
MAPGVVACSSGTRMRSGLGMIRGLCRLHARLGGRIRWHRFPWSGRNSHHARAIAAGRLRACLKARLAENPTARHLVIAHSHGGNVALDGARRRSPRAASRVACLATPFIVVSQRDWGADEAGLMAGGLVGIGGAILQCSFGSWSLGFARAAVMVTQSGRPLCRRAATLWSARVSGPRRTWHSTGSRPPRMP